MRPLTASRPKPMVEVAGKPLLGHMIDILRPYVDDVTIVVGWKQRVIREYFKDEKIHFVEQKYSEGTAHAVAKASFDKPFLCVNSDVIVTPKTVKKLIKTHRKKGTSVITGVERSLVGDYGELILKGNKVIEVREKVAHQKKGIVNAGIYLLTPEIFDAIKSIGKSPRGEYELTSALKKLEAYCYITKEPWLELTAPWHLLDINKFYLQGIKGKINGVIKDNVVLEGDVIIGEDTIVRKGSYILGPVYIGKGCEIGPNCFIRKYTSISDKCRVGNAVEVKNSIVMRGTKLPHHNYVGDSVIGENCNLGSGTKIANLRLDEHSVKSWVKGEQIDTKRKKLGAFLGDSVKSGINSMIDCGTLIGENSYIGPGAFARGNLLPNARIS